MKRGRGESFYLDYIEDSRAVYFNAEKFRVIPDRKKSMAAALQQAIDQVEERYGSGIVFIPEGEYRLDNTVNIWRGIRLIGYGKKRPIFILKENTPGFAKGKKKYMFHFRDVRPEDGEDPVDAQNTTFYSGLNNINIKIEKGNPLAVAVRFRVAQLCSLEHMDFYLGDAKAGVERIGNEIEDCRFFGGEYAIKTRRTSAGWQSLIMDCIFQDQKKAAIKSKEAGLTVIRGSFSNCPYAVEIFEESIEELYLKDTKLEKISRAGFLISEDEDPQNQINMDNIFCSEVPVFMDFRGNNKPVCGNFEKYVVKRFFQGLKIEIKKSKKYRDFKREIELEKIKALPSPLQPEFHYLPSQKEWVNIKKMGARGDGIADDTEILQKAIAEHKTIYFPMGKYLITDTLELKKETVLTGLHCYNTQIILNDHAVEFNNVTEPKPMILTPSAGENIISGLGFSPGKNRGAIGIKWQSAKNSCLDDVWFDWGGHGKTPKGKDQLYAIQVTDGGGGIFKNIWVPDIFSKNGFYVSDTDTEGKVYLMSIEHHLKKEVKLENVENWSFYALQTEENLGSEKALAIELTNCRNIQFINQFFYRVMAIEESHPYAVRLKNCQNIKFRGIHNFSWGENPFTNTVYIEDLDLYIQEDEMGFLYYL